MRKLSLLLLFLPALSLAQIDTVNTGASAHSGEADRPRDAFRKLNSNDTYLNSRLDSITPFLAFKNDSNRSVSDGFSDVIVGQGNGNDELLPGGNIVIGQNNFQNLSGSGSFSGTPYFSRFSADRNVALGFGIGNSWGAVGSNRATGNVLLGHRVLHSALPISYSVVGGYQAMQSTSGTDETFQGVVALGLWSLEQATFNKSTTTNDHITSLGAFTGRRATFHQGYGSVLLGYASGQDASLIEAYNVLICGAGMNASLGRGNIGIGRLAFNNSKGGSIGDSGVGTNQFNVAIGVHVLENSGPSEHSTYVGSQAGGTKVIGTRNNGFGSWSMNNVNGNHNTGLGSYAGFMPSQNQIVGSGNTFVGAMTGLSTTTTAVNNVFVLGNPFNTNSTTGGYRPVATSNTVYFGSTGDFHWDADYDGTVSRMTYDATGRLTVKRIKATDLPTSCDGEESGTIWNDSGTLKICP